MIYFILVLLIIGMEYFLKNKAEGELDSTSDISVFQNRLRLRLYHNQGAFLSMLKYRQKLLLLISCILTICIGILFLLTRFQKGNRLLKLGLSLLLGGAFSNTYDRLKRKYVVDYFSFNTPFKSLNRIVFNVSDFCILIGSLLSVVGHTG